MNEPKKLIALLPADDLSKKEAEGLILRYLKDGYSGKPPKIIGTNIFEAFSKFTICILEVRGADEQECLRCLHKHGIMAFRLKTSKGAPGHRERLRARLHR